MRYAVIDSNTKKVLNVIIWDGVAQWQPPEGTFLIKHDQCGIGDLWHEEMQDFLRPLNELKPPITEDHKAFLDSRYQEAKARLKADILFVKPDNEIEA